MKTLLLMRHAKSAWSDPTQTDHERTLNDRGRVDAPRMGRFLQQRDLVPEVIVSSTATRALQTAEAVATELAFDDSVRPLDELYHSSPSTIAEVVGREGNGAERLLVVCHNPGIEELVERLVGVYERMSTAAIAEFELELDDWSDFAVDRTANFVGVHRPKEIEG